MKTTKPVPCWRCEGDGNLTDDDGNVRFCPTCLGMGMLAEQLPKGEERDDDDSWYRDPQPARLGRSAT